MTPSKYPLIAWHTSGVHHDIYKTDNDTANFYNFLEDNINCGSQADTTKLREEIERLTSSTQNPTQFYLEFVIQTTIEFLGFRAPVRTYFSEQIHQYLQAVYIILGSGVSLVDSSLSMSDCERILLWLNHSQKSSART